MRLTFLGTGTSFGVPQIGCGCAVCRSDDPRDRRSIRAELTDEGRARQAAAARVLNEAEKAVFSGLPTGHADTLLGMLRALQASR